MILFENVGFRYGRGPDVLQNLSFEVPDGEFRFITGASGAGKSSLLRLFAGFSRPDAGTITWHQDGARCPPFALTAYQGHMDAFKPRLTPREALGFWAEIMDLTDTSEDLLTRVGLASRQHVPCGQLSAGQRRRLSLARLLLSGKALWILDEPTAAMDEAGTALIVQLIKAHIARGGSAVIASHNAPQITGERTRQIILSAQAAA